MGELGNTWKYGVWIPHELSPFQLRCRVDSCMELLTSHRNNEWLCNLIIGDEKWIIYVNHTRKRQWLGEKKPELQRQKIDFTQKRLC